jgi:hypothetical protein
MLEEVARFEWVLMLLIPLGLALWELRSVRRDIGRPARVTTSGGGSGRAASPGSGSPRSGRD